MVGLGLRGRHVWCGQPWGCDVWRVDRAREVFPVPESPATKYVYKSPKHDSHSWMPDQKLSFTNLDEPPTFHHRLPPQFAHPHYINPLHIGLMDSWIWWWAPWSILDQSLDFRVGEPPVNWSVRNCEISKRTLMWRQTYGAELMGDSSAYATAVDKFLKFWNGDWTKSRPSHYCSGWHPHPTVQTQTLTR